MKNLTSFALVALLATALASCGQADYAAGDSDDSGGNVGFGGAQDIGQFRGILNRGGIPGESTLDANGFFSEHYTELPPPDCGQTLCLHSMLAVGRDWVTNEYQATLQVAMNTPVNPADLQRLPLNLVVVVDTSGSMLAEDRIGFVKDGLDLLVEHMAEGDRVALVSYDSDVTTHGGLDEPLSGAALREQITSLRAGGMTNIYDGLRTGLDMAYKAYDPERQNRVILLSDGMATAGITGDGAILEMAVGYIAAGINLTTIGVGLDFNVDLMRGLAERGAGNFYFLEDAPAIEEVFVDELDYFVSPLALGVEISVISGSAYDLGEVSGTRLWQTKDIGGEVFIPGVFVASRTSDTPDPNGRRGGGSAVFIAMLPRSAPFVDPGDVAEVELTYRLPGNAELSRQVVTVRNPGDPGVVPDEDLYLSHQAMAENYAMYNIYRGLRAATRSAARDYDVALAQLTRLEGEIWRWNGEFADDDIAADLALVRRFMTNLEQRGATCRDEFGSASCSDGPIGQEPNHGGDDIAEYPYYGCSAAGGQTGDLTWLLLALALIAPLAWRRPKRLTA